MSLSKKHLQTLFAMVMAGSAMGARGLGCGPCNPTVSTVPRLPPDNPDGSPPPEFDPTQITADECIRLCGQGYSECDPYVAASGAAYVECTFPAECGAGRRPRGLQKPVIAASGAAAWLSRAAHLEAAAERAFADLADEIEALGAPASLVRRARTAAAEETRHARVVGALARRRGAVIPPVRVRRGPPRSKAALAVENAVEGCVGETFAALIAHHQAEHARDLAVRRAMRRIADEETSHAALALAIEAWLAPALTPAERRRVARAKARAAARLGSPPLDAEAAADLGLPADREARAFAIRLGRALGWRDG